MIITSGDLSLISLINTDGMPNILAVPSVISKINLFHSKSLAIINEFNISNTPTALVIVVIGSHKMNSYFIDLLLYNVRISSIVTCDLHRYIHPIIY